MPHTSHKKKKRSPGKREQVDEDGWIRITSPRKRTTANGPPPTDQAAPYDPYDPMFAPNESCGSYVPPGVSLKDISKRFENLEGKWLESESWKVLKDGLESYVKSEDSSPITTCILLGTGSMCGLKDNWIMRHDVAIFQTAVFKAVVDALEKLQKVRTKCYAQEPEYNSLDTDFLKVLQIFTVEDPEAFSLMDANSFAYTPGAEHDVSLRTIFCKPALLLTGGDLTFVWRNEKGVATTYNLYSTMKEGKMTHFTSLDDYEAHTGRVNTEARQADENGCRILEVFKEDHDDIKIPDFDMENYPFHSQRLFYRTNTEEAKQQGDQVDDMVADVEAFAVTEAPSATTSKDEATT